MTVEARIMDLVVNEAESVAVSTLRYPNVVREAAYLARVMPLFANLSPEEIGVLHRECGYAHGIGWMVLTQALGLMNGQDRSRKMGQSSPTPLYTPKVNYGGWVRLFRSQAAALPAEMLDAVVRREWSRIAPEDGSEDRCRGTWGISPFAALTKEVLKQAIQESDLFTAPWMAAIWRPRHGWVVAGAATRYLSGDIDVTHPDAMDLFSRQYADQTKPETFDVELGCFTTPGAGGTPLNNGDPGPSLGIRETIPWVEMALRLGYRLDLVMAPVEEPLDTWEDALVNYSETPLMGVLIQVATASYLPSFQANPENREVRLEGLDPRDFGVFHAATGVDPARPLTPQDVESLVLLGIPVFGRIPGFFSYSESETSRP